ncbi:SDR family NAD(P)-dependent oxidoreductase [Streptomyces aureus]|uniref:SDR family NAD(P)-dependent oxidoreductase n=1 Tax=Streptomyces aureus TaxID=193461 RepID=A0ABV4T1L8_9ACTN
MIEKHTQTNWPGIAGKHAMVTGAAGGQGAATAQGLVAAGATVTLLDLDERVRETAEQLGRAAGAVVGDVGDPAVWAEAVTVGRAAAGCIDILVNNAGIYRRGPIEEMALEEIDLIYRVNQLAPMLGARAVLPSMRAAGNGSIINVSSTAGITGDAYIAAYTATKWALRGLTRSLANELAASGIRVNCVIPGLIDTAMAAANGAATNESILARTFLKRMGRSDEVAPATLFLASDHASYITGIEIVVDGGLSV